jgi:hypothetical protein
LRFASEQSAQSFAAYAKHTTFHNRHHPDEKRLICQQRKLSGELSLVNVGYLSTISVTVDIEDEYFAFDDNEEVRRTVALTRDFLSSL